MPAMQAKTASRPGKTTSKTEKSRRQDKALTQDRVLTSAFIGQIYRAVFFPELWPTVLAETAAFLNSTKALFVFVDERSNTRHVYHAHGVDPAFVATLEGKLAQDTPWLTPAESPTRPGQVVYGDHLLMPSPRGMPNLFVESLRQQDVGPMLHACIGTFGQHQLHLIVTRPSSGEPYSADDRDDCQSVVDYIRNAWQLERSVADHQLIEKGAMEALNRLAVGVAMVDSKGEIRAANNAAHLMLAKGDGLHFDLGQVEITADGCRGSLRTVLGRLEWCRQAPGAECPELFAVQRQSRARPYSLLVCPFRPDSDRVTGDRPYNLVFIFDPDSSLCGYSVEFLKRFYDLTPAEARLAKLIAEGERLDSIAVRLSISVHTARTHLKRVFEKTGVERQAELVQLMFGCLGMMQDSSAAPPPPVLASPIDHPAA